MPSPLLCPGRTVGRKRHRVHFGDMQRRASCAVRDLMFAAHPVGDDERPFAGCANGREQVEFGHPHRDVVVLGLVAEHPRHPATRRLDHRRVQTGDRAERAHHGRHRAERFLMAVPVHDGAPLERPQRRRPPAGIELAVDELFEQKRVRRHGARRGGGDERQKLVAQREQARRLQADDRDSALRVRRERVDRALRFRARIVEQSGAEECSSAAQRPAAVGCAGEGHVVAGRHEDVVGGARDAGFEPAVEGVDEQHHLAVPRAAPPSPRRVRRPETVWRASAGAGASR